MNSIISWVGGKKARRDIIYLHMPKGYDRYIEVFGGGGWVLFGKPPDKCMEVYNDFNSNLANLFYCVKERPMALLKELSSLPLNSRDEFVTLRNFLSMEEFKSEHLAEELEIVTLFLREPEAEEIRNILIFSGALVCAECGGVYSHIQPSHKKERYGIPKWKCKNYVYQNRVSCGGGFISDRQRMCASRPSMS